MQTVVDSYLCLSSIGYNICFKYLVSVGVAFKLFLQMIVDEASSTFHGSYESDFIFAEVATTDLNLEESFSIHAGIAHTRWATHGEPSPKNSHPQTSDARNEFLVVHNGVITNYEVDLPFLIVAQFSYIFYECI